MSLQRRRERYAILHMWKLLHQKVNNSTSINFYESPRFGTLATVPPLTSAVTKHKAQSLFDSSFSVKGPQLWNTIPKDIKSKDTLLSFKCSLCSYLKSVPDKPPVYGYSTQNENSILHWHRIRLLIN